MKKLLFIALFFSSISFSFQPTVTLKCTAIDESKREINFLRIDENKKQLRLNLLKVVPYDLSWKGYITAVIEDDYSFYRIKLEKDPIILEMSIYEDKVSNETFTNRFKPAQYCEVI
tara:strand:- start:65 stop:412 length:348 start_codon:yes stop_codon:yes gene_type:complete